MRSEVQPEMENEDLTKPEVKKNEELKDRK